MAVSFRPESADQVAEVIRTAIIEGRHLEVVARGSKRAWGRPAAAADTLDVQELTGIVAYEPEELILTARPATPLAEIAAVLAERHQHLTFEPPDFGPLLRGNGEIFSSDGTLGGAVLCNLGGPRRVKVGAARDHVLGFHGVSGRGEVFKAGGRVVKNVTGFDLAKLVAGSFGTLAVVTELTVRALPAPEETRTLVVRGLDDAAAVQAMNAALSSAADVAAAAHLPATVAAASTVVAVAGVAASATLLRLEGPEPSVAARAEGLSRLLRRFGETAALPRDESLVLWRAVRDVVAFSMGRERQVWRLSVPPTQGAAVVRQVLASHAGDACYDWGGGLVWLGLDPTPAAAADTVRAAVTAVGGHATLIRAEPAVRRQVPVFQPQPPALAALTRRIKESFDPHRVLNPGRMYADV